MSDLGVIEALINQSKQIIQLIRLVKFGDYVYANDHNKLLDFTKKQDEINVAILEYLIELPAAGEGVAEGDYTTWTHKWTNTLPDGLYETRRMSYLIDDLHDVLTVGWEDGPRKYRFGIFRLSNFSTVFLSPSGEDYLSYYPDVVNEMSVGLGHVYSISGGISRSLQSYVLLCRADYRVMEVWRGGAAPLWTRDINEDTPSTGIDSIAISLTGKYILVVTFDDTLVLYEGS